MPHSSQSVVIHNHYLSFPPTIEHLLPFESVPTTIRDSLDPWICQILELPVKQIEVCLQDRWANIANESVAAFRDMLLSVFRPRSIFIHGKQAWLSLKRHGSGEEKPGDIILVSPPVDHTLLEFGFASHPFARTPAVEDFVRNFGSLREHIPPGSGDFRLSEKWETLFDYWGEEDGRNPTWYAEWAGALVVYGSTVGDLILLHPNRKVAWLGFAEGEVWPLANSFDDFVARYANYRPTARMGLELEILRT